MQDTPVEQQVAKKKIQSSIPSLTVGDERKSFNQIRKASEYIRSDTLLWNGMPAGEFALAYVIGHHTKRKLKAQEKLSTDVKKRKRRMVSPSKELAKTLDDAQPAIAPDVKVIIAEDVKKTRRAKSKKVDAVVTVVEAVEAADAKAKKKYKKRVAKCDHASDVTLNGDSHI